MAGEVLYGVGYQCGTSLAQSQVTCHPPRAPQNCFPGNERQAEVRENSCSVLSPARVSSGLILQLPGELQDSSCGGSRPKVKKQEFVDLNSRSNPTCGFISTIHSFFWVFFFSLSSHMVRTVSFRSQLGVDEIALLEKSGYQGETLE